MGRERRRPGPRVGHPSSWGLGVVWRGEWGEEVWCSPWPECAPPAGGEGEVGDVGQAGDLLPEHLALLEITPGYNGTSDSDGMLQLK